MIQVGINGFGRIGRISFRAMVERYGDQIEVVAINDLMDAETNAHLLKYDSNYGRFSGDVRAEGKDLVVNGKKIEVFAEKDPANLPWGDRGVDVVLESTGFFTDANKAKAHLEGGAKKVVISAPAKNEDITIVMGVNDDKYDPSRHTIISNASCTTNGLAPVAKVMNDRWGINKGLLTAVHAYTGSQRLVDTASKDLRDARAAAMNIVPSPTGAAKAVGLVIPELQGKFGGFSFRVPVSTVSVIDFTALLDKETSVDEINTAMLEAANGNLKGILEYNTDPLVSSDVRMNPHSSVFSPIDTLAVGGNFIKVVSWYDNEWGYSNRIADLMVMMAEKGF